jgi:hypothetical protein
LTLICADRKQFHRNGQKERKGRNRTEGFGQSQDLKNTFPKKSGAPTRNAPAA